MHEYAIPKLFPWIIRDAPILPTDAELQAAREREVAEAQMALRILLGENNPAIKAVEHFGVRALATVRGTQNIMDVFGVSEVDALKIVALNNLGQQMFVQRKGSLPYVRGLSDVEALCKNMAFLQKEELRVLLISDDYLLVHEEVVATGERDVLHTTPSDILQPALERKVQAFVLVHNHPSGDPTPSQEDLLFTKELQTAAQFMKKSLLDHVIIAQDGAASCLRILGNKSVDKES